MKVAAIGVGRMGRRHIEAVRRLGFEVAGACDVSEESLAIAASEQGITRKQQFREPAAMIRATRPDCVIIATTAPTHCEYTLLAAEAGVPFVLCEKPMAISLAQCDRMIEVCRRNGTALAINHQMRFMEQYTAPKALLLSDSFGGLRSVTVVAGNFGLSMNALHYFEMFRFMTNEEPQHVSAWFSRETVPNPRGVQFEDRAGCVRMTTPSGRRFYLECSADQGHAIQVIYAGAFGQIIVDELRGVMTTSAREEQYRNLPTTRYGMPAVLNTTSIEPANIIAPSAAVLRALIANENYPTGEEGRLAMASLVASYVSDENGHAEIDLLHDALPAQREFPWA